MMLRLTVLVTLLGVAVCGPVQGPSIISHGESGRLHLLGSKKCTFGPSYWCDHLSKAAECSSVSWCIANKWTGQEVTVEEDHDDVCDICLDMVKQARDQLNSNQTQEELKEVLEGSCNLIPLHVISEECDKLVDEFIPELIEVLSSQMNPQTVCSVAGLCNSARIDKMLEDRAQQSVETEQTRVCDICEEKTEALKAHVTDGGQEQLLDSLLPICGDMGPYSDACAVDLADNIDHIYNAIVDLSANEFCLLGNACPGLFGNEPTLALSSDLGSPVDCDLCIHIVKHWRDILVANTTKEEFKEILDGICSKTKAWAPKCTQLVDEYYEVIYDFLVNRMRAHSICKAIGICARPPQDMTPLWFTIPADSEHSTALQSHVQDSSEEEETSSEEEEEEERVPLIPLHQPRPLVELTPPRELHTVALKKNHVQQMSGIHRVALSRGPVTFGNDQMAQYNPLDDGPALTAGQLPLSRFHLPDLTAIFRPNQELCTLCEFGLSELRKVLLDDATEDEITEKVGKLCDLLPRTLEAECHEFVSKYGTFVITMLAQEVDPDQVCPALRICPASGASEESEPVELLSASSEETEEVGESPTCALCEYATHTLLDYLKDKRTEVEIREGLDMLCDELLPHTVAHECEELVNTFAEDLIDMIVAEMTPDQICITLRLCLAEHQQRNDILTNSIHSVRVEQPMTPTEMRFAGLLSPLSRLPVSSPYQPEAGQQEFPEDVEADDDDQFIRSKRPEESFEMEDSDDDDDEEEDDEDRQSPQCVLCEFVMMQLKRQLDDDATDEEIEDAFKRVCSYMPKSIEEDCDSFVDTYGAALLDALKSALADPDTACMAVHLCQPQGVEVGSWGRLADTSACAECQQIVAYAELLLSHDSEEVTSERLCQLLPSTRRDKCKQLVDTYGPWVFSQLAQMVSPKEICIGIDLCPRPPGTLHLMGGARCLWGPAYFCQDHVHARACNALDLCIAKYWNPEPEALP